jgi:phosphatidylinositol dimannoside acyltransferase
MSQPTRMRDSAVPLWSRALARIPHSKHRSTARALAHASLETPLAASVGFNVGYHVRLLAAGWSPTRRRLLRSFALSADDRAVLRGCFVVGRGVVIVTAHHGDFDLAGAWLAACANRPLCAVVQGSGRRLNLYHRARRRAGIHLRFDAPGRARLLLADLAVNRIVAVALDRRGPRALDVDFCGQPARMSSTPVRLALRAGAPLLVASVARHGDRRLVVLRQIDLTVGPQAATQAVAAYLNQGIRRAPEEWLVPADLGELPWRDPVPAGALSRATGWFPGPSAARAPRTDT